MQRMTFTTTHAPTPVAQYSQAARLGAVVAVAGQVGVNPYTGEICGPGVGEETDQALRNVVAVLAAAGLGLADVVRIDCYLTDAAHVPSFNAAYASWFPADPPARTTVLVGLMPGFRVEITALAVAPA